VRRSLFRAVLQGKLVDEASDRVVRLIRVREGAVGVELNGADDSAIAAATALQALDNGDPKAYDAAFSPTVPLARHCFAAPTFHYKTGITFISWLAGHQSHFTMVDGRQSARSVPHLVELFRLADAAGVLPDPDLAVERMRAFMTTAGWQG